MKKIIRNKKTWIIMTVGYILTFTTFIVTYHLDLLTTDAQATLEAIPSFLFSILILLVTHTIATHQVVEKASADSEQTLEAVKKYLHVTQVGTPQSAWEYVIHRLPALEYVQNTSFNFGDEIDQSKERLYEADKYQNSILEIAKEINHGLKWKDIGDNSSIERFRNLSNQIKLDCRGTYKYSLINQSEPQIGFILLTYKDGTTEVLFNWDFRDIPHDPTVLLSRDREIFNMFAAQYKGLSRASVQDYDSNTTRSTS